MPDFRDAKVLLNKLTHCLFPVILSQSSFIALLLYMVRGAFDWLLPQILVWVERLAVWEVVLQVPMQLHAWRLQLHFEWIMYPEWAILKVLKCRTSIFLMWLVMWTITVKHFVPHPSLVFACNVLLLIIKIIFFKKNLNSYSVLHCWSSTVSFYISQVFRSTSSRGGCTVFLQHRLWISVSHYEVSRIREVFLRHGLDRRRDIIAFWTA